MRFYTLQCLLLFVLLSFSVNAQCPENWIEVAIHVIPDENFETDNTRWELEQDGHIVAMGHLDSTFCVPIEACYNFTIFDEFGDGLGAGIGGFYSIHINEDLLASGINFGHAESAEFGACEVGSSCWSPIEITDDNNFEALNGEVWYTFTPNESNQGRYKMSTCGFSNDCDPAIWLYDRCLGLSGVPTVEETIQFNDTHCDVNQAEVISVLEPGVTYYIKIGSVGNQCNETPIEWSFTYLGPIIGCMDPQACNYNPLATQGDGNCIYNPSPQCPSGPDLTVRESTLRSSMYLSTVNAQTCYINEGCLHGYGTREVLRFTTYISNIGNQDYVIGSPTSDDGPFPQFEWDECHAHWHYEGYAQYLLYDIDGNELPTSFKNGFCVLDLTCDGGGTPQFSCGYQGISAGCSDYYSSGLSCQWLDITDLPQGQYTFATIVNWDHTPDRLGNEETSYSNNRAEVCFYLDRSGGGLNFELLDDCIPPVDCEGEIGGNAVEDCNGVCGGQGTTGDINNNLIYDPGDINMYINGILDENIPATNCSDATSDFEITLEDPVWILDCILSETNPDGHAGHSHTCNFPANGIYNSTQSTFFSVLDHNQDEQFFTIALRNPSANIVASHLEIEGVEITNVELLLSSDEYDASVHYRPTGEIITFSYSLDPTPRFTERTPFLKVFYSNQSDAGAICLSKVYRPVNQNLEEVNGIIESPSCSPFIQECSSGIFIDSDNDGICDDDDICPGSDDFVDSDNDNIPNACDICPDDPTNDLDDDGVCDNDDICIGIDDATLCHPMTLIINFDEYPQEVDWAMTNSNNEQLASGGNYPSSTYREETIEIELCIIGSDLVFTIFDEVGDGICCGYGEGSYSLLDDETNMIIASGGNYGFSESTSFVLVSSIPDQDGDGICDPQDQCPGSDDNIDTDNDGMPDGCDSCPDDFTNDSDDDGVCDSADICQGSDDNIDTDNDGVPDGCDTCPQDFADDSDDDGICDSADICQGSDDNIDTDNDGVPDGCDTCPQDFADDSDGDGICDSTDICQGSDDNIDTDNDGVPDGCDTCPQDFANDSDGDGICDSADICPGFDDNMDTDSDGIPNGCDSCPNDFTNDSDNDGVCDSADICPGSNDTLDADNDGLPDDCDACPNDFTNDSDNDGICDSADICQGSDDNIDTDNDGVPDGCDVCPQDFADDSDNDGVCDSADICQGSDDNIDADNDGVPDGCDVCPQDFADDSDGDGICDSADICQGSDDTIDTDSDGVPDGCDVCPQDFADDSDGDGVCDSADVCQGSDDAIDTDSDGVPDGCDVCPQDFADDSDNDGICDSADICQGADDTIDTDSDGVPDGCDVCPLDFNDDSDNDGVCDSADSCPGEDDTIDSDSDGVPDGCDICPLDVADDFDGDGVCDSADICPGEDDTIDTDNDGVPDGCDACPQDFADDSDGDGICDSADICQGSDDNIDTDNDGVPDGCDACPQDFTDDLDNDGVCDSADICQGSDDNIDTDNDGVPDGCDICLGEDDNIDSDSDGVPDGCDACPIDSLDDSDDDGVCDSADICPGEDDNIDIDNDGIPDGCDDEITALQTIVDKALLIERLHPNPGQKVIHLTLSKAVNGELELVDVFGKQIKRIPLSFEDQKTIDISDLPEGSYLLILETKDKQRAVKRFIKMNP